MSSKLKLKKGTGAKPETSYSEPNQTDFLKEFRNRKGTNKSAQLPNASHSATSSRITHPFAKYNASGQLQCVLCSVQVVSEKNWSFHLQSRTHKDTMATLKNSANKLTRRELTYNGQTSFNRKLRGLASNKPAKKLKSILKISQETQPLVSDKTVPQTELEANPLTTAASVQPNSQTTSNIPADLFDAAASELDTAPRDTPANEQSSEQAAEVKGGDGKLPEGFFDDPKRDAKVRGVKPEEAMEKEWEIFQRLMETETEQSELIVAQQDQLVQLERDLAETHQQSDFFNRAEELRKRQEELAPSQTDADAAPEESRLEMRELSDDESHSEFELELDWRAQAY